MIGKKLKWAGMVVLLAAAAAYFLRPQPVEVELAEIGPGPLRVTVDEDGRTRVREPYVITTPLAGVLRRIDLEPGDEVKSGAVIAVIDPVPPGLLDARDRAESEARVGAAQAALERAQREHERTQTAAAQAERYVERDEGRLASGNISEPMLEDSKEALWLAQKTEAAAEAAVRVADYELAQAVAALAYTRVSFGGEGGAGGDSDGGGGSGVGGAGARGGFPVKAPVDGRVLRRHQQSSATLPAGTELFELGDPRELEIEVDVLSQDAVKIRPGQEVIIEHWGGEGPLSGRVRYIEPGAFTKVSALGVDEQRVYVVVDFVNGEAMEGDLAEQFEALGDGYRVEVRIVVWEEDEVLKVPASALFRSGEAWTAYVAESGKARLRQIEVGASNGYEAEVLGGLEPGERVVEHPNDRIADGVGVSER